MVKRFEKLRDMRKVRSRGEFYKIPRCDGCEIINKTKSEQKDEIRRRAMGTV